MVFEEDDAIFVLLLESNKSLSVSKEYWQNAWSNLLLLPSTSTVDFSDISFYFKGFLEILLSIVDD